MCPKIGYEFSGPASSTATLWSTNASQNGLGRRGKNMEYKIIKEHVRKIVTKHDPDGLIALGAPEDEYNAQTDRIISLYIADDLNFTASIHRTRNGMSVQ
jgi:hypothetical protein